MYTSHRRNFLRQAGVDIEISVVINIKDGKAHHTGKYRFCHLRPGRLGDGGKGQTVRRQFRGYFSLD